MRINHRLFQVLTRPPVEQIASIRKTERHREKDGGRWRDERGSTGPGRGQTDKCMARQTHDGFRTPYCPKHPFYVTLAAHTEPCTHRSPCLHFYSIAFLLLFFECLETALIWLYQFLTDTEQNQLAGYKLSELPFEFTL